MFRALMTMTDIPGALTTLDMVMRGRMTRAGAWVIIFACIIVLGPLCYMFWRFDLQSTWGTLEWLAVGGQAEVTAVVAETNDTSPEQAANDAGWVLVVFGVGFSLLPTATQVGFGRFMVVPGLGELVKVSIVFDVGTDFPTMWRLVEASTWYDQFGMAADVARFIGAGLGSIISSLLIQNWIIVIFALLIYAMRIVSSGAGQQMAMRGAE
jgi:hypothetical protein